MRDTFANEIEIMMQEDPSVLLLTGDLGFGVFDSIRNNYPDNFINIGVAEQNMTGIASGLAMEGFKVYTYSPVPPLAFAIISLISPSSNVSPTGAVVSISKNSVIIIQPFSCLTVIKLSIPGGKFVNTLLF